MKGSVQVHKGLVAFGKSTGRVVVENVTGQEEQVGS
jgi:hypothetical protein